MRLTACTAIFTIAFGITLVFPRQALCLGSRTMGLLTHATSRTSEVRPDCWHHRQFSLVHLMSHVTVKNPREARS